MEDKKRLYFLLIYFFALNTPPMELAVDEVKASGVQLGPDRMDGEAVTTDWCHVSTKY